MAVVVVVEQLVKEEEESKFHSVATKEAMPAADYSALRLGFPRLNRVGAIAQLHTLPERLLNLAYLPTNGRHYVLMN